MLETVNVARRTPSLAGSTPWIRPLPAAARFSLRVPEATVSRFAEVAGFRLDGAINSVSVDGDKWSVRLGPNEWLLIGPEAEPETIATDIAAGFGEEFHALTDVGHRNIGIEVTGPHAPDILNTGCPLDLFDASFPAGTATRTLLGKVEIVLIREGPEPVYRVECWRSFATYVYGFLVEAARDFGS